MLETALAFICILLAGFVAVLWLRLRKITAEKPFDSNKIAEAGSAENTGAEMLSSLLDAFEVGCIVVNSDNRIVFANEAVSTLFPGLVPRPGSALGSVILDHRILDFIAGVERSRESAETEFELSDGSIRFLHCTVSPLVFSGERDEKKYLSITVRDVTTERETERIRKDFVANASHELRTPLSIINGYLENFLEDALEVGEESSRAYETMARHGDRIARIVDDMLTISQFESNDANGLRALRAKTFDFSACAADVVSRLAPVIKENKTSIHIDIEPASKILEGDHSYWDQVLFNLVDNAIKENVERLIEVSIAARCLPDGTQEISVSDNGVGIPASHLPFVFKRFYRVAKHHGSTKIKGTGLGLSIVKRAVEAHGGEITLTSTPGIKTTFTIRIPPLGDYDQIPRASV